MMPTPWLIEAMGLRMRGGHNPDFIDQNGDAAIFDPSVMQPGHEACLVEKNAFCDMLDREDLTAIWVIAGEKSVYGNLTTSSGYGGRISHTGIYRLDGREVAQHHFKTEAEPPAKDQLLKLLKLYKIPSGLRDWVKQI